MTWGAVVLVWAGWRTTQAQGAAELEISQVTASPVGFTLTVTDRGGSVASTNGITLLLDNRAVQPTSVVKEQGVMTITYENLAAPLAPLSQHEVRLGISTGPTAYTVTRHFGVPDDVRVPASLRLPPTSAGLLARGFQVKTVQANDELPDSIYRAEVQLAGLVSRNWANLEGADAKGWFTETGVINYGLTQGAKTGHFPDDAVFPGIADSFATNAHNYFSCAVVAAIRFPVAGRYVMGVTSDDGFRTSVGHPDDAFPLTLGRYDGMREAAETVFSLDLAEPGDYPLCTVFEQGADAACLEWFSLPVSSVGPVPEWVLINSPQAGSLKAYQYSTELSRPPHVKSLSPGPDATRVGHRRAIEVTLVDGTTVVIDPATIRLTVDNLAVQPDVTKTNGETTVRWTPPSPYAPNTNHTAMLVFGDRASQWQFATAELPTAMFFIEVEDFDRGGSAEPAASVMPYLGGAYVGEAARYESDYYFDEILTGFPDLYREGEENNVPHRLGLDRGRILGEVKVNFYLGEAETPMSPGWHDPSSLTTRLIWFNYTRHFPSGPYHVYAAISRHENTEPLKVPQAELWQIQNGGQLTNWLGQFSEPRWQGRRTNDFVQLQDTHSQPVIVSLAGEVTLRYVVRRLSGDPDFLLFVPAPRFTRQAVEPAGEAVIEWAGDGRLQTAAQVTGPWTDVSRALGTWTTLTTASDQSERYRLRFPLNDLAQGSGSVFFRIRSDRGSLGP